MIPVGPGGEELSYRSRLIIADALAEFKHWRRETLKAADPENIGLVTPQAMADAWASSLWNAIARREEAERVTLEAIQRRRQTCHQISREGPCQNRALYLYTWPGRDEAGICERHKAMAEGAAAAMGLHVQFIPLEVRDDDRTRST